MTFHVIPWMWGIDGDKTCGISDTFYITETGCGSFFEDVEQNFTIKPTQPASNEAIIKDISQSLKTKKY
jgi:Xaa-Pro dipeptidase